MISPLVLPSSFLLSAPWLQLLLLLVLRSFHLSLSFACCFSFGFNSISGRPSSSFFLFLLLSLPPFRILRSLLSCRLFSCWGFPLLPCTPLRGLPLLLVFLPLLRLFLFLPLLKTEFMKAQSCCIPQRKITPNGTKQPEWFNKSIAEAISNRQKAYNISKLRPSPETKVAHIKECRNVDKLIRRAKLDEEDRVAAAVKDNPKSIFCSCKQQKASQEHHRPFKR